MPTFSSLLVGIASFAPFGTICQAQQPKPTLDQILEVWTARQDKIMSGRFQLDCQETKHKGSISFMDREARQALGMPPEPEPNPPRDYLVKGTSTVIFDGVNFRYAYDHQQWDPVGKRLYTEHFVDVFDGHLYKLLIDPASGQQGYPSGNVRKARASESALSFPILPLVFTFRGNHPQFFQNLVKFHVTGKTTIVAGRPCIELVRDTGLPSQREFLYVDSNRDYLVLKEMIVLGGQPNWQLDISYESDATVGWVPKSWEYVIRVGNEHRLTNSARTIVTSYEVNSRRHDENEFNLAFPPNTRVTDETSDQEMQYVIRENGERGTEIPTRLNPSYEDLQKVEPRKSRWGFFTLWTVVFALALGAWIWLRLRRKPVNGATVLRSAKSLREDAGRFFAFLNPFS